MKNYEISFWFTNGVGSTKILVIYIELQYQSQIDACFFFFFFNLNRRQNGEPLHGWSSSSMDKSNTTEAANALRMLRSLKHQIQGSHGFSLLSKTAATLYGRNSQRVVPFQASSARTDTLRWVVVVFLLSLKVCLCNDYENLKKELMGR